MRLKLLPSVALLIALGPGLQPTRGASAAHDTSPQQPQRPQGAPAAPATTAWPDAPAPVRIRFIGSLTPQIAQGKPSAIGRLWRTLVGGSETPPMRQPYGVSVARGGKLYVTDVVGGTLHVFNLLKRGYSRIETGGESLVGIAARDDLLYVTDSVLARVTCLRQNGEKLWSIGRAEGLQRPTGIVATADRLYVVDTLASHVLELGPRGAIVRQFGGRGEGPGQFNYPTSIAADREGRLYVTDTLNFRIQIFSPDGQFRSAFGKLGDGSGDLNRPKGIGVDSDGNIHVVEGLHDVGQIFSREGRFLLAYGESGSGPGQLWLPTGMAIADDAIYVADSANARIQIYQYLRERR